MPKMHASAARNDAPPYTCLTDRDIVFAALIPAVTELALGCMGNCEENAVSRAQFFKSIDVFLASNIVIKTGTQRPATSSLCV